MKLEEQVLSVDQMQHLKELGVEVKDASFAWCIVYKDVLGNMLKEPVRSLLIEPPTDKEDLDKHEGWSTIIPTLTLQEILEMLPTDFLHYNEDDTEVIYGKNAQMIGFSFERIRSNNNLNILDCAYQTLCWCAANGYLNKE